MMPRPAPGDSDTGRLYSGYALLALGVLFWSGNAVVGRAAADVDFPPLALNFWRWASALAVFLAFFGRRTWRQRSEILSHWRFLIPFCLVSIVGFNCALYIALQKTTALQASLIQSILPVLVLLLCLAILRTPITLRQWLGVVLSVGGAALIVVRGDMSVVATLHIQEGDAWALIAVVLWAIQAFMTRWRPGTIDIIPFMTIMALLGVIVMTPLYAWESITVRAMPFNWTSILFILYVGIFASVLGTTMWNEGTYRAGAAQAGYFGNLYPIFAGALAILILGETLRWYHLIGAALVFAGICLAIFQRVARGAD
ncbi:MAG: DMT family transporter [Woeseiaceae bacterium]|nr:DMT family transporter [Woeseiaceae bacterium]